MRAAIYARFSTDKQDVQSIADQIRVCTERAKLLDAEVVHTYRDEGISGQAVGNRPGFLSMRDAALAREFDLLLVADLSRISRTQADLAKAIDRMTFAGVRIVGLQEGYDSACKGSKLVSGMSGIMAEQFRELISEKTRAALETRAMSGSAVGGCPYGYRTIVRPDGRKWLQVEPGEAEVVRRIFTEYAQGRGSKSIAYRLNADGIASPGARWNRTVRRTDGQWHPSTILGDRKKAVGILQNEIYAGRFLWSRSAWVKHPDSGIRKRKVARGERIVRDAPELRIVDDLLWQRVRARSAAVGEHSRSITFGKNRARGQHHRGGHLFSTLLKCSICGCNFTMSDKAKYGCATRINCGPTACDNDRRIRRTTTEHELLESLRQELRHGDYVRLWVQEAEQALAADSHRPVCDVLPARLAEVRRQIDRMVRYIQAGTDSPTLAEALRAAEAEKSRLEAVLAARAEPTPSRGFGDTVRAAAEDFAEMLDDLPGHLGDPDVVFEARAALREWMGDISIVPTETGAEAQWRLSEGGLLVAAGPRVAELFEAGEYGSGGALGDVPQVAQQARLR